MDWLGLLIFVFRACVEISILFLIIYACLRFIRGTRSSAMLAGIIITFVSLALIVYFLKLEVLDWILSHLFTISPFLFVVLFQPEIRRGLTQLGVLRQNIGRINLDETKILAAEVVEAAAILSKQKIGSLIAIEHNVGLRSIVETGTLLHARLSGELLTTIFSPKTQLHDGGVVINKNQIVAAGCIFPLTQVKMDSTMGTRHRAGMGLSEETDALIIITSEETGRISIANNGKMKCDLSPEELREFILGYFSTYQVSEDKAQDDFLLHDCEESLVADDEGDI